MLKVLRSKQHESSNPSYSSRGPRQDVTNRAAETGPPEVIHWGEFLATKNGAEMFEATDRGREEHAICQFVADKGLFVILLIYYCTYGISMYNH